ncbi:MULTISPECIES: C40 family peptidase [Rufibacter]|uniref:C40 family peptidase n=1 Tax=Rufibacter TaxID=1379908 RepID=UPI001B30F487|nr:MULTISPECIES: C40 family peptidase [Rufibacter]
MMKSYILSALALGSAFLSFFYEVQPSSANNYSEESLSVTPSEQIQEWALEHNNFSSNDPLSGVTKEKSLTFKDSLFYNYYSQSLGLKLDYDEDKALLETVADWIGTPYRSGGNTQRGTDCSGFVSKVYKQVYGITLTHSSRSMFHEVSRVSKNALETGDLVFFRRGPGQPIYHVGIYLEDGKFIHAASNGGVMINSLMSPYYKRNFYAAGRPI